MGISNPLKLTIENVFGDIESQEQIGRLIFKILTQRNKLLDEMEEKEKNSLKILRMGPQLGVGDP